ncbi:MAG: hypothetical protein N2D54_03840, partial [Chloroflexota bacterium]
MSLDKIFAYKQSANFAIKEIAAEEKNGVLTQDLTYLNPFGQRRGAYYVRPAAGNEPTPCVLWVHWYETEAEDSNRKQFLAEAQSLAQHGTASLLIETMWSERAWFMERDHTQDKQASINQVVELRQAMDLLLSQPGVDTDNFAYVGHDFGAMYGVVMGAVDPRPKFYVL